MLPYLESTIAKLQSEVALRDANIYNDQKLLEVYKYVDGELKYINSAYADIGTSMLMVSLKTFVRYNRHKL